MQIAVQVAGCVLNDKVLAAAAAAGQLRMCQWLRRQGCPCSKHVLAAAAGAGHQALCAWLFSDGCQWHPEAVYAAARGGHPGLALWLQTQRPPQCTHHADLAELAEAAAEGCELVVLQRQYRDWLEAERHSAATGPRQPALHLRRPQADIRRQLILAAAAASPTPDWREKVIWLEEVQGHARGAGACCRAAAVPDAVERLEWLRLRGYPAAEDAVSQAARAGNGSALSYLLTEARVSVKSWVPAALAAIRGHVGALQVLHACRCPVGHCMQYAADGGHLAVAVWLVKTLRVKVEELDVVRSAASSGSVALLRWLCERGARFDENVSYNAALSGCEEALEWLAANSCPMKGNGHHYRVAASRGDLATLRCLRRLWCPVGNAELLYDEVGARGDVTTLRCLLDEVRIPWRPGEACFNAWVIRGFPLASLRWLLEEAGCPVDWQAAVEAAEQMRGRQGAEREQEDVVGWLRGEVERRQVQI